MFASKNTKMRFIRPTIFTKLFYPKIITRIKNNENKIFLTFDDCKDFRTTLKALEILDTYKIQATFFVTGKYATTDLIAEIKKKGNRLGNHSFDHLNGYKSTTNEYVENVTKCKHLINSDLFRPPYGKITINQYSQLVKQYKIILWDVLTYDFDDTVSKQQVYKITTKYTRSGSIIVMHTNSKTYEKICYSLPKSIEYLLSKNFKFDVIT